MLILFIGESSFFQAFTLTLGINNMSFVSWIRSTILVLFYPVNMVIEQVYNAFLQRVSSIFRDKPYYAFAELALFEDITFDVLLFHINKYPGVKLNGHGLDALRENKKHDIVNALKEKDALLHDWSRLS